MPPSKPRDSQRIAKLLARAGIASRREIERMIAEGRIALDGVPIDTPATLLASLRGITVDGKPVQAPAPARLFRYHKPPGLLTTERDPKGRPTIYDRLPKGLPRVVPVGRLDLATEGLLLLTTDGELKRQLELPATGVERSYRARAYGQVSQAQLEELMLGVEIEGVRYGSINANLERRTGANVWVELTLTEGKNREVRRVLEHLGLQVSRLIRTRYGPFLLGDLPAGDVDEVRQHDLVTFRKTLATGGGEAASRLQFSTRTRAAPEPVPEARPVATGNRAERRKADVKPRPEGEKPRRTGAASPTATKKLSSSRVRAGLHREARSDARAGARPRPPTSGRTEESEKTATQRPARGKAPAPSAPRDPDREDAATFVDRPKRRYRPTDRRPRRPGRPARPRS